MKSKLEIDVVFPVASNCEYLEKALTSVIIASRFAPGLVKSITLYDNACSHDKVKSIHHKYELDGVRYVRFDKRYPIFSNWNKCVQSSNAPWVHLMHDDDLIDENFYYEMNKLYQHSVNASEFICSNYRSIDSSGKILGDIAMDWMDRPSDELKLAALRGCPCACAGAIFTKDLYERINGFDESYRYTGDWDFFMKAFHNTLPLTFPIPLVSYRVHESSVSFTSDIAFRYPEENIKCIIRAKDNYGFKNDAWISNVVFRSWATAYRSGGPLRAIKFVLRTCIKYKLNITILLKVIELVLQKHKNK